MFSTTTQSRLQVVLPTNSVNNVNSTVISTTSPENSQTPSLSDEAKFARIQKLLSELCLLQNQTSSCAGSSSAHYHLELDGDNLRYNLEAIGGCTCHANTCKDNFIKCPATNSNHEHRAMDCKGTQILLEEETSVNLCISGGPHYIPQNLTKNKVEKAESDFVRYKEIVNELCLLQKPQAAGITPPHYHIELKGQNYRWQQTDMTSEARTSCGDGFVNCPTTWHVNDNRSGTYNAEANKSFPHKHYLMGCGGTLVLVEKALHLHAGTHGGPHFIPSKCDEKKTT